MVLAVIVIYLLYKWAEIKYILSQYERCLENIYERSLHENDDQVRARVEQHEEWLRRSENPYGVEVVYTLFRDKDNPLETWEEYEARDLAKRKEDMRKRHNTIITKYKRVNYMEQIHGQYARPKDLYDVVYDIKARLS